MGRNRLNNPKNIVKTVRITDAENEELKKILNLTENFTEQRILKTGLKLYINQIKSNLSFIKWLTLKYKNFNGEYVDNIYGDLLHDIEDDKNFPDTNIKEEILNYLISKHACYECINTFKDAFKNYKSFKNRLGGD